MRRGVLVQHQPLHRLARPPLPMTAPPVPSLHQSRRLEPVLHPGVGPRPAVRLPVLLPEMPHVPARVLPRVQRLQRGDLRVRSLAVRAPGRAHVPKSLQTPCLVPRRPAPERPVAHPQHLGRPRLRHPLAPPRSVHLRKPQHPHFSQHLRPVHPASLSAIRNRTSYVLRNRTDYVPLTGFGGCSATRMFLRFFGRGRSPATLSQRDWDRFIAARRAGKVRPTSKAVVATALLAFFGFTRSFVWAEVARLAIWAGLAAGVLTLLRFVVVSIRLGRGRDDSQATGARRRAASA